MTILTEKRKEKNRKILYRERSGEKAAKTPIGTGRVDRSVFMRKNINHRTPELKLVIQTVFKCYKNSRHSSSTMHLTNCRMLFTAVKYGEAWYRLNYVITANNINKVQKTRRTRFRVEEITFLLRTCLATSNPKSLPDH